jgi:uncharacterized cupin superfamily protein
MKQVNQEQLPWVERRSPKGTFRRYERDLSGALRSDGAGPALPSGVPFEVELVRLPSGAANFPFHSHSAEWECYVILAGSGAMRAGDTRVAVTAGDVIMCPPGEAHQLVNDGEDDLTYYVIANNSVSDVWHYPDSNKWGFALPDGEDAYFRTKEVGYYDREE